MPKIKSANEKPDYRYWLRMDNEPVLAEALERWARDLGHDYPANFIKYVFRKHAYKEALRLGVTTEADKLNFEKPLTK